eukprot:RCo049742
MASSLYGNADDLPALEALFLEMAQKGILPDIHGFSLLLRAYARRGEVELLLQFWERMVRQRVRPSGFVFAVVIRALAAARRTEAVQHKIRELSFYAVTPDMWIVSSLLNFWMQIGRASGRGRG